jgi:hypothetical protein
MLHETRIHPALSGVVEYGFDGMPRSVTRNIAAYSAADCLARLVGGQTAYAPNCIGFVYGATDDPSASLQDPPDDRTITIEGLATELSGCAGNILVSSLAAAPLFSVDGADGRYTGNAVTLSAHTAQRLEYVLPNESPYADPLDTGMHLWQALLMARVVERRATRYIPFARVSLKSGGEYPSKPENLEMSLYWTVSIF